MTTNITQHLLDTIEDSTAGISIDDLSKDAQLPEETIAPMLSRLQARKLINLNGDRYILAPKKSKAPRKNRSDFGKITRHIGTLISGWAR